MSESEDPIRKYSKATEEFNEAYSRVRSFGMLFLDVAHQLNNKPYDIGISGISAQLPPEMALAKKSYTLNAKKWPTAEQIAESIASLYNKREKLNDAWESLSPTDRGLVTPPDTK